MVDDIVELQGTSWQAQVMVQSFKETFDTIVIGAGPAGENVAARTTQSGLRTLLIESELVGGECSYWACMPSKALIRPATALRAARDIGGSREALHNGLDLEAVLRRRDSFTSGWNDEDQVTWVEGAGIVLRRGSAKLLDERLVSITNADGGVTVAQARHAVVFATGSAPITPEIPGLADTDFWGTREATSTQHIPASLTVIGGGVAGTELAQIYARLGSHVVQLVRGELLAQLPGPARRIVRESLRADGVDVREQTTPLSIHHDGAFQIELGSELLRTDRLLIATGRKPALAGVGLEELPSSALSEAGESPRCVRRLFRLRGSGHGREYDNKVSAGAEGSCCSYGGRDG